MFVVDDMFDVVWVVYLVLCQYFRVFSVFDGLKGFVFVVEYCPILIIIDLSMPEADGFEFMCCLCDDVCIWYILIVMLIVCGDLEDRVLGLEIGVNVYLVKFFAFKELLSMVCLLFSI